MINLYVNFYQDKNPERQEELTYCLKANIATEQIDRVYIFLEEKDLEFTQDIVGESEKVRLLKVSKRPSYNDYFKFTHRHPEDINIIANTDIIIGAKGLKQLNRWNWKNYCLALSRWDLIEGLERHEAKHYNHSDSQDTWILKGAFPDIPLANFTLGVAGCDNRIAYELSKHFHMVNAAHTVKTYHYHITGIRNYHNKKGRPKVTIRPPYKKINSTGLI